MEEVHCSNCHVLVAYMDDVADYGDIHVLFYCPACHAPEGAPSGASKKKQPREDSDVLRKIRERIEGKKMKK